MIHQIISQEIAIAVDSIIKHPVYRRIRNNGILIALYPQSRSSDISQAVLTEQVCSKRCKQYSGFHTLIALIVFFLFQQSGILGEVLQGILIQCHTQCAQQSEAPKAVSKDADLFHIQQAFQKSFPVELRQHGDHKALIQRTVHRSADD